MPCGLGRAASQASTMGCGYHVAGWGTRPSPGGGTAHSTTPAGGDNRDQGGPCSVGRYSWVPGCIQQSPAGAALSSQRALGRSPACAPCPRQTAGRAPGLKQSQYGSSAQWQGQIWPSSLSTASDCTLSPPEWPPAVPGPTCFWSRCISSCSACALSCASRSSCCCRSSSCRRRSSSCRCASAARCARSSAARRACSSASRLCYKGPQHSAWAGSPVCPARLLHP